MMKRLKTVIMMIFITLSVFAADPYIVPYDGTYVIPMDSPAYRPLVPTSDWVSWGTIDSTNHKGESGGAPHDDFLRYLINDPTKIGNYSDFSMISMGGYTNISLYDGANRNHFDQVVLRITVESPSGLNFISLGNPSIIRPYGVGAFGKMKKEWGGSSISPVGDKYFMFVNSGDSYDFVWKNISEIRLAEIWYDMVLILPGNWDQKSSTLADSANKVNIAGAFYELIEAHDYSSVANITIELYGRHGDAGALSPIGPPATFSVPMSGFFVPGDAQRTVTTSVGLHILPNNNCANLNINNQQGKLIKIGDINLLSKSDSTASPFPGPRPQAPAVKPADPGDPPDPLPHPKDPFNNTMNSRPKPGYKNYFHTGYRSGEYDWPRSWKGDKTIYPTDPEPDRSDYVVQSAYDDDYKWWAAMQPGSESPEYKKFLACQAEWDNYVLNTKNTPEYRAWQEKRNELDAWNAAQKWDKDMAAWRAKSKDDLFIFFSSSPNESDPHAGHFMLTHEDKPVDTPLNARNHIKFDIVTYDKTDKSARLFNGTDWYDPNGDVQQFTKFIPTHKHDLEGGTTHVSKPRRNRKYEGEIYLVMENKPNQIMIRGKYTEKIYVHVIAAK